MEAVESYLDPIESKRIREAYRFSDTAHLGQFRTSGEPYISHPISVAEICAEWRLDSDSLMAALLHDVMEDSGVLKQDLHERFGSQVADIVDGLSKIDRNSNRGRMRRLKISAKCCWRWLEMCESF
jgi:GTP diphosphokinase / guanosine-3',5'-bis(diphosphate) 3'-diphosphatase